MFQEEHFIILAGFIARLAYELHDNECIGSELREDLLHFWRMFNQFENEYHRMESSGELNNYV